MTGDQYGASTATTAAQRAEDRSEGGGGRLLAWLLTPFAAVVPWWLMCAGVWVVARALQAYSVRFTTEWGTALAGVAVLLLAAVLWAAVTAWSSVGTTLAGVCTLAFGLAMFALSVSHRVYDLVPRSLGREAYFVLSPLNFVLMGSLLIAAGLGAAAARRIGRRRR